MLMPTTFRLMNKMDKNLLKCSFEEDGTLLIEWDENDPACKIFNGWTEKDFKLAILHYLSKNNFLNEH